MTYNKINRIDQQQISPTTPQQVSGAGAVNNKPIDFSQKTKEEQKSEVLSYINSDEFKKLPVEEQLKLFKEKFCPSAELKDVQKYLSMAKQAASMKSETSETSVEDTKSVVSDTSVETQEVEADVKDEFEQLVLNYAKANNLKDNIDDIIAVISSKANTSSLTDTEQKILDQYNKNIESNNKKLVEHEHKHMHENMLIPIDEMDLDESINMSPADRLKMYTKAYLEKHDDKYNKLSDEEKQKYLNKKTKNLAEMVGADEKRISKGTRNSRYNDAITLLKVAHGTNTDLSVYENMEQTELKNTINKAQDAILKDFLSHIDPKTLEGKTPEEKLKVYADHVLSFSDSKYNELSGDAKKAYLDKKCGEFLANNLGIENWDKVPEKAQNKIVELSSLVICKYLEQGGTISEFKNMTQSARLELIANCIKDSSKDGTDIKIADDLLASAKILKYCEDKNIEPTNENILSYLQNKMRSGKATESDIKILKTMEIVKNIDPEGFEKSNFLTLLNSPEVRAAIKQEKFDESFIKEELQDITPENVLEPENLSKIRNFVNNLNINDNMLMCIDTLKDKGLSEAQLKEVLGADTFAKFQAAALAEGDGAKAASVTAVVSRYGSKSAKAVRDKAIEMSSKYLAPDEMKVYGKGVVKIQECIQPFTKSVANRQYLSKEDAADITTAVLKSASIPDANKALMAKSTIEAVAQNGPQEQLYFGSELSKISIPAVTEGLAAASNSVDESVRSQYNSYVETAAASYPPETQAAIKKAISSGEISKSTLEKTSTATAPADAPAPAQNADRSDKAVDVKQPSNNNNVSENNVKTPQQGEFPGKESAVRENRTSSPMQPSQVSSRSRTVTSSSAEPVRISNSDTVANEKSANVSETSSDVVNKSSAKSTSVGGESFETSALEAKKEAAMQNALDTKESIEQAQADREIEQFVNTASQEIIEELALEGEISQSDKEKIVSQLKKATTINEVYEIVSKIGGQDIFLDRLSSGSAFYITSFVKNINNPLLVQDLYLRCSSESVKKQLLNNLPEDYIYSMLDSRKISNMQDVDKTILRNYILKNINSLRSSDFTELLSYLSLYDREDLVNKRNSVRNINPPSSTQTSQALQDNYDDVSLQTSQQVLTPQDNNISGNPANSKNADKVNTQPKLEAGEISKTLSDGSVITRKGTTFGGISSGADDDLYRKVSAEELQGNPKGMNDEILTPGSEEWRRKYNKQQAVPPTAFTTAAFEDDENNPGFPFGSSKVGMRKQIKKKGPFYYNG